MIEKLRLCLLLICLQGGIEDGLKVGRGGSARLSVSLGHGLCSGQEGEQCSLVLYSH